MKKTKYLLLTLLITTTMLLGACNLPQGQSDKDADATTVAETAAAVFTHAAETAAATGPTATSPATVPATATAIPTNTLFPTQAATATNTPIPCNRASFVKDVTIPDNTNIDAGATFTKTWRLKNNGSCTWTSGYVLLFDSGDQMGAPATKSITSGTVAPGATVDISVDLTAPATPGTYQGNFKLRSPDNIVFGINADGQGPFWVKIVVPNPTATPTATTVPKPDLYITQIEYSTPHNMGDTVHVSVSVYNGGNANAGPFKVKWYSASTTLGCDWDVASLVHTGGYVLKCDYVYAGWNHNYTTSAVADSENTVNESDETNNTKTQTLDVGP